MTIAPFGFDNPRPGMVVMWDDPISEIPVGWAVCDGNNGTIDMSGKFPCGVADEASVGNGGGLDSITLSVSQLPAHGHPDSTTTADGDHYHTIGGSRHLDIGSYGTGGGEGGRFNTSTDGAHEHNITSVGSAGGGGSIENRPKFYEVVFIQKL